MIENKSFTPTGVAVADALLYTRGIFEDKGNSILSPGFKYLSPESKLEKVSKGYCDFGSIIALKYLQRFYKDQFDRLMLVTGRGSFEEDYNFHVYFLAHNNSLNLWYAGSPANHKAGEASSPFETNFASENLEAVFSLIKDRDGGKWPMASEVLYALNEGYQPPVFKDKSEVLIAQVFTYDYNLEIFDPESVNSPDGLLSTHPPFDMVEYVLDSSFQKRLAA